MVAGAIGPRGVNVTSAVVKARNSEIAPAPTHPPQATEASVKENLSRARRVKPCKGMNKSIARTSSNI